MVSKRLYVQESASLADKKADGTYDVVLIDEGAGSTGIYSAELLKNSAHLFENAPSFINHPIDPERPDLRDLNSIAGRVSNVRAEERDGKVALVGTYKPRSEYATLFEEFSDIIGLSIFSAVDSGTPLEDGRIQVESFAENDPYRSVDAVVAAGRGGRFERATESLRAIESSLGLPQGNQPGATAAPGDKERNPMDEKVLEALNALKADLAPVIAFVNEQKAAAEAAVAEAKAQADAAAQEKEAAIESYSAAVKAVSDAELLPSQEKRILEAAKRGEDVAPLIEEAKAVVAEAKAAGVTAPGYVIEKAAGETDADFSFNFGGRR